MCEYTQLSSFVFIVCVCVCVLRRNDVVESSIETRVSSMDAKYGRTDADPREVDVSRKRTSDISIAFDWV